MATTYQIEFSDGDFVKDLLVSLGEKPDLVSRVVLDISADDLVKVYVERYAEAGSLRLVLPEASSVKVISE